MAYTPSFVFAALLRCGGEHSSWLGVRQEVTEAHGMLDANRGAKLVTNVMAWRCPVSRVTTAHPSLTHRCDP